MHLFQNTGAGFEFIMLSPSRDSFDEEFGRPVESIMRCEDFKSNFARRLSNRYISRSPVSGSRQDTVLKLCPTDTQEIYNNVPERIEHRSQLSKSNKFTQSGLIMKPQEKPMRKTADMRHTEVTALNLEVETLRWQLAQTEANRQMHIALLKQIVTFLNRVKEHIEGQQNEPGLLLDNMSPIVLPKSLNVTDLPRTRSVLHVSKNIDYSMTTTKKISTKKISKSISNVNGYKDGSGYWGQSKLSLVSETETGQKLTEEMSRLITLANTVLATKLPDLACSCPGSRAESAARSTETAKIERTNVQIISKSLNVIEDKVTDKIVLNTNCKSEVYSGVRTSTIEEVKDRFLSDFIVSQTPLGCQLDDDFSDLNLFERENQKSHNGLVTSGGKVVQKLDKRNDYNASSNFIEDESGFSSMSSFQEIGIPIINIIPPSPKREVDYLEDISLTRKWEADGVDVDKQSVQVFWV